MRSRGNRGMISEIRSMVFQVGWRTTRLGLPGQGGLLQSICLLSSHVLTGHWDSLTAHLPAHTALPVSHMATERKRLQMTWWQIREISAEAAEKAVHIWSLVVVATMRQFQDGAPGKKKSPRQLVCYTCEMMWKKCLFWTGEKSKIS